MTSSSDMSQMSQCCGLFSIFSIFRSYAGSWAPPAGSDEFNTFHNKVCEVCSGNFINPSKDFYKQTIQLIIYILKSETGRQ